LTPFLYSLSGALCYLHSFPTRRSSDLGPGAPLRVPPWSYRPRPQLRGCLLGCRREPCSARAPRSHRTQVPACVPSRRRICRAARSEEHTSELQSRENLVCRLLLEKKNV